MERVQITFLNGDTIEAEVNASSYIVDEKPDFPDDITDVTIEYEAGEGQEGNNGTLILRNVEIIECASVDGRYWFAFREKTEQELWQASIEDALCELSMDE